MRRKEGIQWWVDATLDKLREHPNDFLASYWRGQVFGLLYAMGKSADQIHALLDSLEENGDAAPAARLIEHPHKNGDAAPAAGLQQRP